MAFGNLGTAFVTVRPQTIGFGSALSQGLSESFRDVSDGLGQQMQDLGKKMLTNFALPLGVALAANLTQWQALDAAIRETVTLFGSGGVAGVVTQQLDEMDEGIFNLSKQVGVLQEGISEGLYQAISAGIPRNNVFEFLETAEKAAIGGATDLTTAVDGLTTGMNAFGYGARQAGEVADIMFRGVARGKTTFEELSASMARAAPLAAGAGVQFEEFIAIVAAMTFQGTQTAEAFTNVKAALTGLLRPSEDMNDIWAEAGYLSGEAAIQALGLQGAMDLVSESVDGSVSSLIKLLGGAEAANAVLQVTGESAEVFNSILGDTQSAAGATEQAFAIMQDGVGRSFGQLTAAFDRVGSEGGKLAAGFAEPVVDALTGIVSTFADWTRVVAQNLKPVHNAFKSFVDLVFNNPVIQVGITVLASLAVVITAVGTALGAALITAGSFVSLMLGQTVLGRVRLLRFALGYLSAGALLVGKAFVTAGLAIKGTGLIAATTSKLLVGVGTTFGWLARIMQPKIFLAVTAAIAGIAFIISKSNQHYQQLIEDQQALTIGADKLADSLGLVTKALDGFEWPDARSAGFDPSFMAENSAILEELTRRIEMFGEVAGERQLQTIAIRWVQQGNDPEEVMRQILNLQDLGGLPVKISFDVEDISGPSVGQNLVDNLLGDVQDFSGAFENLVGEPIGRGYSDLAGKQATFLRDNEGIWREWAQRTNEIWSQVGPQQGLDALEGINAALGTQAAAAFNRFYLEGLEQASIDETTGVQAFDFDTSRITSFRELMEEMTRVIPGFNQNIGNVGRAARRVAEEVEEVFVATTEGMNTMTPQQIDAWNDISDTMIEAYGDAADYVLEKQDEITQKFLDQMPLLGLYGGALKHTFTEWRDAQDAFQKDFKTWNEDTLPAIVEALGPELAAIINESEGLDSKAWLANLNPADFETAMEELRDTYSIVTDAAEDEIADKLPGFVDEARTKLDEKFLEMQKAAASAGGLVAKAFRDKFGDDAKDWAPTGAFYARQFIYRLYGELGIRSPSRVMVDIANNLADSFSSQINRRSRDFNLSPSVSGSSFGSGGDGKVVNQNLVLNYPTSNDPVRDSERILGIARTIELISGM